MMEYSICYFDTETQKADTWDTIGWIKANSPIEALKQWYQIINARAGRLKDFCYEATPTM